MFLQTDDQLLKSSDISKQTSDTLRSFKGRAENMPSCRACRQSVLKSCGFDLKFPVCFLYINIVIRDRNKNVFERIFQGCTWIRILYSNVDHITSERYFPQHGYKNSYSPADLSYVLFTPTRILIAYLNKKKL